MRISWPSCSDGFAVVYPNSMTEIVLATFNRHKLHEFSKIAPGVPFLDPRDLGIRAEQAYEEGGDSFFENAFGKARHLAQAVFRETGKRYPVLADDSGLCVPALDGAPGVLSARFGAELDAPPTTDAGRNALLLERLRGKANRRAYYVCCLVLYLEEDRFWCAQEAWNGTVAYEPSSGTTGFGYDPIILVEPGSCAVADLSEDEKASRSHRARAYAVLAPAIAALF